MKQTTYRIKTQTEFENEITIPTRDWRLEFPNEYIWKSPQMDKLFGMEFTTNGYNILLKHKKFKTDNDELHVEFIVECVLKDQSMLHDVEEAKKFIAYFDRWQYHSAYFKRIEI